MLWEVQKSKCANHYKWLLESCGMMRGFQVRSQNFNQLTFGPLLVKTLSKTGNVPYFASFPPFFVIRFKFLGIYCTQSSFQTQSGRHIFILRAVLLLDVRSCIWGLMCRTCVTETCSGVWCYWYLAYPKYKYLGFDVPHVCRETCAGGLMCTGIWCTPNTSSWGLMGRTYVGRHVLGVWCVAVCNLGKVYLESDVTAV